MKIPIMTIPYNISLEGIVEKIEDSMVSEKIWENKKCYYVIKPEFVKGGGSLTLNGSAFGKLAYIIYNSLYQIAPPLKGLILFFKKFTQLIC